MWFALILLGCTGQTADTGEGPTLPACTFSGTFDGGLRGQLDLEEDNCSGAGNPGYMGARIETTDYQATIMIDDGLILTEGASFTDVVASLRVVNVDTEDDWVSQNQGCTAQVTDVTLEDDSWGGELFVHGTVACAQLYGATEAEDASLTNGSFFYRVY